jgi:hypothetical protein
MHLLRILFFFKGGGGGGGANIEQDRDSLGDPPLSIICSTLSGNESERAIANEQDYPIA